MSRYLAKYLDMPKLLLRFRFFAVFLRLLLLLQVVHQTFEIAIVQEGLGFGWDSDDLHRHKTKILVMYIHPTFHNGFAECLSEALVCNGFQRASFMRGLDISDRIVRNKGGTVAQFHQFGITSAARPNGGIQIPGEIVGDSFGQAFLLGFPETGVKPDAVSLADIGVGKFIEPDLTVVIIALLRSQLDGLMRNGRGSNCWLLPSPRTHLAGLGCRGQRLLN